MKFVHLAPRTVVGMIKRRGLRMGNGRLGRGVYAVPLLRLPRYRTKSHDDDLFESWSDVDFSAPLASHDLWRWRFSDGYNKGLRPIAVMFEPPAEAWPVEVNLDLWPFMMAEFIRGLKRSPIEGVRVTRDHLRYLESALSEQAGAWFTGPVDSAVALGALLRLFVKAGGREHAGGGDRLEVVFRRAIPPRHILRLFALSQTNLEARRRRSSMASDLTDDEHE